MQLSFVNADFYDTNRTAIAQQAMSDPTLIGNFAALPEGALLLCRGLDPSPLTTNSYSVPAMLPDELQADYRARIDAGVSAAYASAVAGTLDAIYLADESMLDDCRATTGWPQPPTGV